MVVGDVYVADGVSVLSESDAFLVTVTADINVEITNIYVSGPVSMFMVVQGGLTTLPLGTITESQLDLNIHIDESVLLQLVNDSPDPVTVAIDGIYTRRPPTVFT